MSLLVSKQGAGLALGHGLGESSNGNTNGDQNRYMFWATAARVASGALTVAASGLNYVMTRKRFWSPQYPINNLRLHFSGFASTEGGTSPQESVLPGNAVNVDGVWVSVNGGPVEAAAFAGSASTSFASGSIGSWTDDLILDSKIPAESYVDIYTLYHCAVGEKMIPVHLIGASDRVWGAANAASLLALLNTDTESTAALAVYPSNPPMYYGPDFMVAKGWDGRPVALVVCDSIGERQNDNILAVDSRNNMGWLRRWLDSNVGDSKRIPHFIIGIPGASSARELSTNSLLRWDILDQIVAFNEGKRPFTCVLNQMGRNDYNATYATTRANWKALNNRILTRHPGTPIIGIGQVVHPNSTDGFQSLANQGYQVGGEWPAGLRYQLEADKAALMDGTLAAYIDVVNNVGLDTTQGKWPIPHFVTSLAAQAGTDGTTTYTTYRLVDRPLLGELLYYSTDGITWGSLGTVIEISGVAGDWVVTSNATTLVAVIPEGTKVYSPNADDGSGSPRTGTHPRVREIKRIAAALPQSEKSKLL